MQVVFLLLVHISICISEISKEDWYSVSFQNNIDGWLDIRYLPEAVHSTPLSTHYNSFADRQFKFKFPFYEEKLQHTLATTQGFLYMGKSASGALYETQYIAPLMAGFKPAPSRPQDIRHYTNGSVYINQWSDMSLALQRSVGVFTFQVQLHCDGTIKFLYREVPISISGINNTFHTVKVGLSDAYRDEQAGYTVFRAYHTLDLDPSLITSNTSYTLTPKPTCASQRSCKQCSSHSRDCRWCPALLRCARVIGQTRQQDKYHKLWETNGCQEAAANTCNSTVYSYSLPPTPPSHDKDCVTLTTTPHFSTTPISVPDYRIPPFLTTEENKTKEIKTKENNTQNTSEEQIKDKTDMTIVATISITAACIAAVLVISALLILKLRKPVADFKPETCTVNLLPSSLVTHKPTQPSSHKLITV